jgi:phenylalanyl-tRNA synthetase beta chain
VAKGMLEGLFAKLGIDANTVTFKQDEREGLHPGRTASIYINDTFIGCIGQVHPTEEKAYEISETYVFELDVDALIAIDVEALAYDKLPRYPSMTRDIALVVEETVQAGALESVIKEAGGELLKDVHLFDVYQGEHMETGKKSLAFSLRYYNDEQTLTEEEVTKAHQVVLDALAEKAGATLRG